MLSSHLPSKMQGEDLKTKDPISYSSSMKRSRLNSMLSALIDDPILSDVPKKPSLSDVETLISLEMGSAMKISVLKLDATSLVLNSATVKDLKLAIKRKINDTEQSQMGHRHISWRHVWANFCLLHHNEKLIDDNALLQDFGIHNNSQFIFCSAMRVATRVALTILSKERCASFHMSCRECLKSIHGGENTDSFMVSANDRG